MIKGQKVTIAENQIMIGNSKLPLISGEFHYWRNSKSNWGAILQACKKMGLRILSTYVAWSYHEVEPGRFDFTGETAPERDLEGFLKMAREAGFYLIMRPGPFIYAEWPNGGPPARVSNLPRMSKEFLAETKVYIDAVTKVMQPYLATRGGNIILVQSDNEPWPNLCARCEEEGASGGGGLFAKWLEERYHGDLGELNRKWRALNKSFSTAAIFFEECYINRSLPLNGRLLPSDRYAQRFIDGQKFVEYYATQIIATIAEMYRSAGVDVPMYANGWHPYAQNLEDFLKVVDLAGVDGLHRNQLYYHAATYEDEYQWYLEAFKMVLHDTEGLGYAAEMGIGYPTVVLNGHLKYSPKVEGNIFNYLLYMANGMKAWNWYTLVERDGWVCGAINPFGLETCYAPAIHETLKVADAVGVATLESMKNISLITHKGHRYTESGNWLRAWNALLEADLDFSLVDPNCKDTDADVVFYGGSDWLPVSAYERIQKFLSQGRTLVFFSQVPVMNEYGEYVNPLKFPEPDMVRPVKAPFTFRAGDIEAEIRSGGHGGTVHLAGFRSLPEDCEPIRVFLSTKARAELVDIGLNTGEEKHLIAGYCRKCGKGQILYIGCNPHPQLVDMARRLAGASYVVRTDTPNVLTHIWKRPQGGYALFVVNRTSEGRYARLQIDAAHLDLAGKVTLRDIRYGNNQDLNLTSEGSFSIFLKGDDIWAGIIE